MVRLRTHDDDGVESNHGQNDTVWTQPVGGTTAANRPKVLSPTTTPPSLPLPKTTLPILPDEVIVQILVRLPVRSLFQFKSVCKSWETLISSAQFAKDHLQCSIADPTMTHPRLVTSNFGIVSCSVQSLLENPSSSPPEDFRMPRPVSFCRVLGSCNGLLCLLPHPSNVKYFILWNPSLGFRYKNFEDVVPHDIDISAVYHRSTFHGFGYDHVHDKYKLLVGVGKYPKIVAKVYTFGANSWTTIQDFTCPCIRYTGMFVSGTLNWVTCWGATRQYVILSVDLGKESFCEVLLPDRGDDNCCHPSRPVLSVLRNCLCVSFDQGGTHLAVWLMKEFGVQQSWTKLVMIPYANVRQCDHFTIPIYISENGIVVLLISGAGVVLYNSNDGRVDYPMGWNHVSLDCYTYQESLVSPMALKSHCGVF